MINNNQKGLSLIEVLVVISLVVGIFVAGSNVIANSRERAISKTESDKVIQFVKETQNLSISAHEGKNWGMRCAGNSIQRFSFSPTAAPTDSETYTLPSTVTCVIDGPDIRFEKLIGHPIPSPANLSLHSHGETIYDIEITSVGSIIEN